MFLSNMTEEMLRSGLAASGLEGAFDGVYSTDAKKTFKPSSQAYQIALDELRLPREEILLLRLSTSSIPPRFLWSLRAGQEEHKIKPHILRSLPKHTAVLVHCERGFKKTLLPPIEPDGTVSPWFRRTLF